MRLSYDPHSHTAKWENYYPFGSVPVRVQPLFLHRGIARLLEENMLRRAENVFPNVHWVQSSADASFLRKEHLGKRRAPASFSNHVTFLRQKIGQDTYRARKEVEIPSWMPRRKIPSRFALRR